MSPDGRRILFSVTPSSRKEPERLQLLDIASRTIEDVDLGQSYHTDRRAKDIVWAKTSDSLLFLTTEERKVSFWSCSLADKNSRLLFTHNAAVGAIAEFEESPDGRSIAFVSVGRAATADTERRNQALVTSGLVLDQVNGQRYAPTIPVEIWIWNRASGEKHRVYAGRRVSRMAWSPDSTKLAVQSLVDRPVMIYSVFHPGGDWGLGVSIIDVKDGHLQRLQSKDLQSEWLLGWSPDSRSVAIDSQDIIETSSSPSGILGMAQGRRVKQWTFDPDTGAFTLSASLLIPEPETSRRIVSFLNGGWFHWHRNGHLYYNDMLGARTTAIAGAKPGAIGEPVSDRRWHLSKVSFAEHAELAAGVRESVNDPQELALIDLRNGDVKPLTTINQAPLPAGYRRVEPIAVTNRFGYVSENWLIKPPDYDPAKRYPLVILLYGFSNAFADLPWMKNFAPFDYARTGAMVLLANYPEYDGKPAEGRRTIPEQWRFSVAANPLASLEAAIDKLAADRVIDPSRVAICGFSYGGFLTQYAVTHSSKFSAAFVNDGGGWNPGIYYRSGMRDASYLLLYDYIFGGPPFGRGEAAMRDFLPAYRFGGVPVPVLLEGHGTEDSLPQFADFYLTARQEGTPIEAVVYKDDHILTDRTRQHTSIARSTDWLRYWLLDAENPHPLDADQYIRWAELRKKLAALKTQNISKR
jgi:dipeptidyl aminopeptidase/acylaminoacyl peptidase